MNIMIKCSGSASPLDFVKSWHSHLEFTSQLCKPALASTFVSHYSVSPICVKSLSHLHCEEEVGEGEILQDKAGMITEQQPAMAPICFRLLSNFLLTCWLALRQEGLCVWCLPVVGCLDYKLNTPLAFRGINKS